MTEKHGDTELEDAFRDGLHHAADRAEVGTSLADRARAGATTRRRRRWASVSAVAAVVTVAGVTAVVRTGGDDGAGAPDPQTATQPTFAPVTDWRPESWHGVTVDVPADWGWGTTPLRVDDTDDQAFICGDLDPHEPYVGRPIMLSDACGNVEGAVPSAPYVWLGADVEPGTVDLGNGYTQETVTDFGTTVTVASQDTALREHVLGSVRATADCEPSLPARPEVVGMPIEGMDPVHSAQLCAYQQGQDGYDLVYASTLDEATAQALYAGGDLGSKNQHAFCDSKFGEYVRVRFSGADAMLGSEVTADWVVDPGCRQVEIGPGFVLPLKDSGMQSLTAGTGLPKVLRALIGMLG